VEADEMKRNIFLESIKDISCDSLVYIDESGIDMNICKDRGWSKKGTKINSKKSGKYYQRTNIIAALNNNRAIAPFIFNGSCNTELFNLWVEEILIPELKPGQVIIADNAAFHKSPTNEKLLEEAGCRLLFLPPYSPDLNPIEKFWANMKRWIKQKIHLFDDLYSSLVSSFSQLNTT
jgi:transposase